MKIATAALIETCPEVELLGAITRAPKALGWKPSYFQVWDHFLAQLEAGMGVGGTTAEGPNLYAQALQSEEKALQDDYFAQQENIIHWPECKVRFDKLHKNSEKQKFKRWLKELAFLNHLGPYKGWLFPTTFGPSLEVLVGDGFRSVHPEVNHQGVVPAGLESAVSDFELLQVLRQNDCIGENGKSTIYTYKVNRGNIVLPYSVHDTLLHLGQKVAEVISFSDGASFTIDVMLSGGGKNGTNLTLNPIELHTTPLGVYHDFLNSDNPQALDAFIENLASKSPILIYVPEESMSSGFYASEVRSIAALLKEKGCKVKITSDKVELCAQKGYFVFPYKADFDLLPDDITTTLPVSMGRNLEDKSFVNELLANNVVPGVIKPTSRILYSTPYFYEGQSFMSGENGCDKNVVNNLLAYHQWMKELHLPSLVVIKPLEHHQWNPQILHLGDPSDGNLLFKHLTKYGPLIVEDMVNPNLVLGNGEVRVFYQVK